jgi:DNA-binding CsgD family transcriptional regulator
VASLWAVAREVPGTILQTTGIKRTIWSVEVTVSLGEELTPKKLEVLGLLATRLSRREIGQCLYVSLNTVKTHQRALYRKLGVGDRNTAVKPGTGARPALTHPATPARSRPIPHRRGAKQSQRHEKADRYGHIV